MSTIATTSNGQHKQLKHKLSKREQLRIPVKSILQVKSPEIRSVRADWSALILQTKPQTIKTVKTHTQIPILLPAMQTLRPKNEENADGSWGFR